ncbi:MAG: penicillin-binding protein 1C [Akkermansiaceae bacterium]
MKEEVEAAVRRPIRLRLVRCCLVLLFVFALGWFVLPWFFELPAGLQENATASPSLLDRHGEVLRHLVAEDFTRSSPVKISNLPQELIDCTIAVEDKRFSEHHGIDVFATGRAAFDLVRKQRVVSGASTITQQLAKISGPPVERNLKAKFFEAMAARRLEMTWEKDRILEAYFNRLDYGSLRISPTEAARFYFQKPLSDLSLGECALLAGLPQAPSRLNPLRNPKAALARREVVLDRLAAMGEYSAEEIAMAKSEVLRLRPLLERNTAPWLNVMPTGESQVRSTLDASLQGDVENIVREEVSRLKSSNLRHAAVVVIDNVSGDILAMVSSADWDDPRGGQIHGALSPRSPGSTLKPFTYLLSFRDLGKSPASIVADIPTQLRTEQGLQLPENYDKSYRGPVPIRTALACSLNVPALRELRELGGPQPLYGLLESLGIFLPEQTAAPYGLGLTLGNAPVRLLELTNAYACLARGGWFLPTRLFLNETEQKPVQVLDRADSWLIADILSDKEARAPAFSTGGPLDLPFRCAVKTGTSTDFRDNWCVGFTPEFTVGVWAGNFENQPMKEVSGVSGAGPIFHRVLVRAHSEVFPTWFAEPVEMKRIRIDYRTGKQLKDDSESEFARDERLPLGKTVFPASASDYDPEGRAILPAKYRDWFESSENFRRDELVLDASTLASVALKILSPTNGSTVLIDPDIPGANSEIRLRSNLPDITTWECETLEIQDSTAIIQEGVHTIIAIDARDGSERQITITVERL